MASAKEKDLTGLAVKPKTGWIYVRKNKNKPGDPGRWNQNKRLEAVTTYLSTGNLALTGRLCNIPDDTIRKWKASEWWQELTDKYYDLKDDNVSYEEIQQFLYDISFNFFEDDILEFCYNIDNK